MNTENNKETFVAIKGYEGIYSINQKGQVLSVRKGKLLSPLLCGKENNQYYRVILYSGGQKECLAIHRLLALTFLKPIEGFNFVNHKDTNTLNNDLDNLEFLNTRSNSTHYIRTKKTSSKYTGVTWKEKNKKWAAQIVIGNKHFHLGSFENEEDAAKAYKDALKENNLINTYCLN